MPTSRIYPNATTGGGLGTNAASHHAGLSDGSDGTYSHGQVSSFINIKLATGPSVTQIPTSSGVMKGVTVVCRAYIATGSDGDIALIAGENANNRFPAQQLTTTPTNYSSAQLNLGGFAAVNGMGWNVGLEYIQNGGPEGRITELAFDVEWTVVSGFTAFIISFLGPMVALGLQEMPAVSAALWRKASTRLGPGEMALAWRSIREDPRRRYFIPARVAVGGPCCHGDAPR